MHRRAPATVSGPLTVPPVDQHPSHTAQLQLWAQAAWPGLQPYRPRGSISKTALMQDASLYLSSAASPSTDPAAASQVPFPPGYEWYHRRVTEITLGLIVAQVIGAAVLIVINKQMENACQCATGDIGFNYFVASMTILLCAVSLILIWCDSCSHRVGRIVVDCLTGLGVAVFLLGGTAVSLIYPQSIGVVPCTVCALSLTAIVALRSAIPKATVHITTSTAKISGRVITVPATAVPISETVHPVLGQVVQLIPNQLLPYSYTMMPTGYDVAPSVDLHPPVAAAFQPSNALAPSLQPPS